MVNEAMDQEVSEAAAIFRNHAAELIKIMEGHEPHGITRVGLRDMLDSLAMVVADRFVLEHMPTLGDDAIKAMCSLLVLRAGVQVGLGNGPMWGSKALKIQLEHEVEAMIARVRMRAVEPPTAELRPVAETTFPIEATEGLREAEWMRPNRYVRTETGAPQLEADEQTAVVEMMNRIIAQGERTGMSPSGLVSVGISLLGTVIANMERNSFVRIDAEQIVTALREFIERARVEIRRFPEGEA